MELEPNITEVELIRDHEKNTLEPQALKALKLYLKLIKQDRYNIKNLVDCFPSGAAKRKHDQSASSDSESENKGYPETLHKNLLPRLRENALARHNVDNEPHLVDKAGMKKWSNDMLKGHLGGRASTWEQWGNSFALQFKGAMDTMSQSLRIKEDLYINMFAEKERVLRDKIKTPEQKLASLMMQDDKVKKLETDNSFLREKLRTLEDK